MKKWPDDFLDKIICYDCLKVMKHIPDGVIDLVVTDPPYSLGFDFQDDNLDYKEQAKKYAIWLGELHRIAKPNSTICIFSSSEFSHYLYHEAIKFFSWQNDVIWYRDRGHPITKKLSITHEVIEIFTKGDHHAVFNLDNIRVRSIYDGKDKRLNPKGKNPGSVWYVPPLMGRKIERITENGKAVHPTQKPIDIILPLVIAYSNEDDVVLDPFIGVGTTAATCIDLKRHYIGIDNNQKYCDIARQRTENASIMV